MHFSLVPTTAVGDWAVITTLIDSESSTTLILNNWRARPGSDRARSDLRRSAEILPWQKVNT